MSAAPASPPGQKASNCICETAQLANMLSRPQPRKPAVSQILVATTSRQRCPIAMLQILGKASSINAQGTLDLVELDLAFTREDWGSGFRATSAPEFLALNPNAMVPVIRDGDFTLWESNTILRYRPTRACHPSLPDGGGGPRSRGPMDGLAGHGPEQVVVLRIPWRLPGVIRLSGSEQIARSSAAWARHMAIVEGQLERTGGFIAGASFTLADIPIGLSINRWLETPLAHEGFPATLAYMERMGSRRALSSIAATAPLVHCVIRPFWHDAHDVTTRRHVLLRPPHGRRWPGKEGVHPRQPRIGYIRDHQIVVATKAVLTRADGKVAAGMVYALTHRESTDSTPDSTTTVPKRLSCRLTLRRRAIPSSFRRWPWCMSRHASMVRSTRTTSLGSAILTALGLPTSHLPHVG